MSRRKVAVLGCGPAGLLAALAATQSDCQVDVFSKIVKSRIGGAQYLYRQIPALTAKTPDGVATVRKLGTERGYAAKVYDDPAAVTSWNLFGDGEKIEIWNMQQAYERLWDTFGSGILDMDIAPKDLLQPHHGLIDEYDYVLSCIPKRVLCVNKAHVFTGQDVWIRMHDPGTTDASEDHHWIEYDGRPETPWYRSSCMFGYAGFEYGQAAAKPDGTIRITKPLANDCDCWHRWPTVKFLGRYGKWQKGELIHHAYEQTKELLRNG